LKRRFAQFAEWAGAVQAALPSLEGRGLLRVTEAPCKPRMSLFLQDVLIISFCRAAQRGPPLGIVDPKIFSVLFTAPALSGSSQTLRRTRPSRQKAIGRCCRTVALPRFRLHERYVWWTGGLRTTHFLQNISQFSQLKELEELEPSLYKHLEAPKISARTRFAQHLETPDQTPYSQG
jgi:hypothetical protein